MGKAGGKIWVIRAWKGPRKATIGENTWPSEEKRKLSARETSRKGENKRSCTWPGYVEANGTPGRGRKGRGKSHRD